MGFKNEYPNISDRFLGRITDLIERVSALERRNKSQTFVEEVATTPTVLAGISVTHFELVRQKTNKSGRFLVNLSFFGGNNTGATLAAANTIFTIPEGYRPVSNVSAAGIETTAGTSIGFVALTDGTFRLVAISTVVNTHSFGVSMSWIGS